MTSTATALSTLFLYLDIETIPSQDPAVRAEIEAKHTVPALDLEAIQPAANLKDPEKVAADLEKRRAKAVEDHAAAFAKAAAAAEDEYRKTALDGTTGHIACASMALNDDEIINVSNAALGLFSRPHVAVSPSGNPIVGGTITIRPGFKMVLDDERKMLEALFKNIELDLRIAAEVQVVAALEAKQLGAENWFTAASPIRRRELIDAELPRFRSTPTLVAHHAAFDVRFIWQRAIVLGVKVPEWWPHDARPWDTDRLQDTMTGWAGHGNRIGLDRLCRALGIQGKGDIDGSKVWDAIREGRLADVTDYCDGDVERLRAVHRRIRGLAAPVEPEQDLAGFVNDVTANVGLDFANATGARGNPIGWEGE